MAGPRTGSTAVDLRRGSRPLADRYVYLEALAADLYPVSRGLRSWSAALADGSIKLFGDPNLVKSFPSWFIETAPSTRLSDAS